MLLKVVVLRILMLLRLLRLLLLLLLLMLLWGGRRDVWCCLRLWVYVLWRLLTSCTSILPTCSL